MRHAELEVAIIYNVVQAYINRISELHSQATTLNDSQALEDLNELILLRVGLPPSLGLAANQNL